jgi:diacylglycerol kinase (ATP)
MLNTVVEAAVDLASPAYHPLARIAKDVSAGAVLVTSLGAIAVGLLIFLPHLLGLRYTR